MKNFVIGAIAGCGAVTVSNPMDCAKTRLQLQGELRRAGEYKKVFNGVIDTVVKTYTHEGVAGLQKGLITAYVFQVIMNGLRLGIYESSKRYRPEKYQKSAILNLFTGLFSGFTGGVVASPFQLIKTRQQSNSFAAERYKYNYKGIWEALTLIYGAEGFKGLYHGALAFGLRTAMAGGAQLSTYDMCKHFATDNLGLKDDQFVYLASSLVATASASLVMSPFDVVSTRLYNQKYSNAGSGELYKGPIDCMIKIVKIEGPLGLYKGFTAVWGRLAPHSILFLMFSEQLKGLFAKY